MSAARNVEGFTRLESGELECDRCGRVVKPNGSGVGSHRRFHRNADQSRANLGLEPESNEEQRARRASGARMVAAESRRRDLEREARGR